MTTALNTPFPQQFIERSSRCIVTKQPIGDRFVHFLYHRLRENAPTMFKLLTSKRISSLLAFCHNDMPSNSRRNGRYLFESIGADWRECCEPLEHFDSHRKVFERKISYWENRPLDPDEGAILSPSDARLLLGSLTQASSLFIKEKLLAIEELFGLGCPWLGRFRDGDFAVFRLTPDKYHYNHLPVSGKIVDIYDIDGRYHSCNPAALIAIASLYCKNRRLVTIIDTDTPGGSRVGLVAMVEIVAHRKPDTLNPLLTGGLP